MAANITTPSTGLFGESWTRRFGPRPLPVQDQPHVWEHSIFYLASLEINGDQPYTFSPVSYFQSHNRPVVSATMLPATSIAVSTALAVLLSFPAIALPPALLLAAVRRRRSFPTIAS
jgi:hypothetical protein